MRLRPGRRTLPRLRVNPVFAAALRECKLPYEPLALACGCRVEHFSVLINSVAVPATPRNIQVLQRAAAAVKYPIDRVFLDELPALAPVPTDTPLPSEADRAADRLQRARNRVAQLEEELRQLQTSENGATVGSELVTR